MTHAEPVLQTEVEDLRDEIEDLRAQVQFLRTALVAREAWMPFLRSRLRPLRWWAREAVRRGRSWLPGVARRHVHAVAPYRIRAAAEVSGPRLRVVHALAHVGLGGSSRIIVDLIEHLPGVEHTVITARRPEVDAYLGLDAKRVGQPWGVHGIRTVLRSARPDIVHVHYVAGDPRLSWGEADWRWYHQVFAVAREEGCRVIENVNIPVPPYVSAAVGAYVHVSDYVARRFATPAGRNVVIHPGSDTDFFSREPQVPLADDSVGMVYRLQREKLDDAGIDPLVEIVRRRPHTRAYVIGSGELLPVYRRAAVDAGVAGAFEFPGYVPYESLPEWYGRLGVVVAPVIEESFGQVVPFAMSMGIPVVGYRVGALPEIIADDSLLVAPGDSAELARVVVELLDDRERRLAIGRRNRQRAVDRFSLSAMVHAYGALYASMTTEPRALDLDR
jgi:glycosyltransferase involved in cell wall biosynthesis